MHRWTKLAAAVSSLALSVAVMLPSLSGAYATTSWRMEGIAWMAANQGDSVYRMYNTGSHRRLYTASVAEKESLLTDSDWQEEGVAFKSSETGNPVYRLYDSRTGRHFYTANKSEREKLSIRDGWKYEGVAWHTSDQDGQPVYRMRNARTGEHVWTVNRSEVLALSGGAGISSVPSHQHGSNSNVIATDVWLPNYYTEDMVFQRGKEIQLRGMTTPSASITVSIGDSRHHSSATTIADENGTFELSMAPLPASVNPYSLEIRSGETSLFTLERVYVGDVFVAAGQSNMELNRDGYINGDINPADVTVPVADIPEPVDDQNIHFIMTDRVASGSHSEFDLALTAETSHGWLAATADNAELLGYLPQFFAEQLRSKEPDVPVGIIQTAWGGTYLSQHLPNGNIYGNHIAPLTGFNVAGVLWYQGEADALSATNSAKYQRNFETLIDGYRNVFDDPDLPFLYVQLARYGRNAHTTEVRQAQWKVLQTRANVAMTVSLDTDKGTEGTVHPLGKDILAARMAEQWESLRAGHEVPMGPIAQQAVADSDNPSRVTITFEEGTANRLQIRQPIYRVSATPEHNSEASFGPLQGFEAADDDGIFKPASAFIAGDTVVVTAPELDQIKQIRYLWDDAPSEALLYNGDLLPASPFLIPCE